MTDQTLARPEEAGDTKPCTECGAVGHTTNGHPEGNGGDPTTEGHPEGNGLPMEEEKK